MSFGRLDGKVAIVTGGARGIGWAIAEAFALAGAKIAIAARSEADGADVERAIGAAGGDAWFCAADIADPAAVDALVEGAVRRFGRLDIAVHNAAAFSRDLIEEMTEPALDRLIAVNLKACFYLARASVPHMRRQKSGRLLVTSSITGPRVAMPGTAHYAATKAGVNGFIRTAALEFAGDSITVNGVEPGYIDTPAMAHLIARFGLDAITRWIPAKRLGSPEDIAHAMLYLASDEARYVTGQTIVVDGGSTLPESPIFMQT